MADLVTTSKGQIPLWNANAKYKEKKTSDAVLRKVLILLLLQNTVHWFVVATFFFLVWFTGNHVFVLYFMFTVALLRRISRQRSVL